jgi:hypothetical protein
MSHFNGNFFEQGYDIVNVVNQGDADTDITGDWINVSKYESVLWLISKFGSEDVDTLGFQVVQATSNGGTAKGVSGLYEYYYKQGTLTSQTVWTRGVLTSADDILGIGSAAPTGGSLAVATDTNTDAAVLAIVMPVSWMDVDGGYDWATIQIEGDEVNNAALITVQAILCGSRFPQRVPLSAIS